jgi:exosome complex exonuclease RRP6
VKEERLTLRAYEIPLDCTAFILPAAMDPQSSKTLSLPSTSFDDFNTEIQAAALKTTRFALTLPADVAFHRSMDHQLAKDLDTFSARVLNMTNNLLALAWTADGTQSGKGKGKLESQDDLVDRFHSVVVDSMDQLLERAVSSQLVHVQGKT